MHLRAVPRGHSRSIAWLLWHSARTEDVAINMLLAGTPQVLEAEDWFEWGAADPCASGAGGSELG